MCEEKDVCTQENLDWMGWRFVHKKIFDSMERVAYRNQFIDTALWMVQVGRVVARRGACKPLQSLPSSLRPRIIFSCEYLAVVVAWAPARCDEVVASRWKSTTDAKIAKLP